jgi:hypothetical protein
MVFGKRGFGVVSIRSDGTILKADINSHHFQLSLLLLAQEEGRVK